MLRRFRLTTILVCYLTAVFQSPAQEFRPRGQSGGPSKTVQVPSQSNAVSNSWSRSTDWASSQSRPQQSNDRPQQSASAVSADLLQAYAQTKLARTESDVTTIARSCANVVSDKKRSKADQDYAASLLAWALNRRGEMRSEQAENLVRAGKVDSASKLDSQAADDFSTAVRYAPGNWRHRHNFAISLAMKGEYRQAIEQLNSAIEINPNYANARFNRAELYLELGDFENAEEDYTAAIEQAQDAQYFNSRAHCRFLMQSYTAAIEDYRRAAELNSSNAGFATDLGDACQFLGYWDDAAKAYKQAVAADAQYARAYQNAAWLMATCPDERIRNTELAISAARKVLQLTNERTAEAVETLAAATAATGDFDKAVTLQKEAIEIVKNKPANHRGQLSEFEQRLELYQAGKTYIQPQPAIELLSSHTQRSASTLPK